MKRISFAWLVLLMIGFSACEPKIEDPPEITGQYFTFSLNGSSGAVLEGRDTLKAFRQDSITYLYGKSIPGGYELEASFKSGADSGTFAIEEIQIKADNELYLYKGSGGLVSVSNYGAAGEMIRGRYTADLKDTATNSTLTFPVNGIFNIKRSN